MPMGEWRQEALTLCVSKDMANSFSPSSANQPSNVIRWRQPSSRKKKQVSDTGQNAIVPMDFLGHENKYK